MYVIQPGWGPLPHPLTSPSNNLQPTLGVTGARTAGVESLHCVPRPRSVRPRSSQASIMPAVLLALVLAPGLLTVPIQWAQPEGRLVMKPSVGVKSSVEVNNISENRLEFYETLSRIDLGSNENMMLPTQACVATGCSGKSCTNPECSCAPQGLSMPAVCPGGGRASGSHAAKNGRTYATCAASDVSLQLGGRSITLRANDIGPVNYMTAVAKCDESAAAKTGFDGDAPFPRALFKTVGSSIFSLSQRSMQMVFGAKPPANPVMRTPYSQPGGGGRIVTIVAVNGVPCGLSPPSPTPTPAGSCHARCEASYASCDCDCFCSTCQAKCGDGCYDKCHGGGGCKTSCPASISTNQSTVAFAHVSAPPMEAGAAAQHVVAAVDSGNGAFLSYGPGSPLKAANSFPFNVTFAGGDTMVFLRPPKVNGRSAHAHEYTHNVLALGFMADYDVVFDDGNRLVYFA